MIYYARLNQRFYIAVVWLLIPILNLVRQYQHGAYDYIWLILGILLWSLLARTVFFTLYLKLLKKPIFTANEYYVFDHFDSIKYFGDDIDELVGDGDLLVVQLNAPAKYYGEIKIPYLKFVAFVKHKVFKRKLTYCINLDLIDIKKGKHKLFMDTLNDLRMSADV